MGENLTSMENAEATDYNCLVLVFISDDDLRHPFLPEVSAVLSTKQELGCLVLPRSLPVNSTEGGGG